MNLSRPALIALAAGSIALGCGFKFSLFKKKEAGPPAEDDRDTIVQVQIFLDQSLFGPGRIDGRMGEFTNKAAAHYNASIGAEPGNWYFLLERAKEAVPNIFTTYTIEKRDLAYVRSDLPAKPDDQEGRDYLGYRSLREFISERFHTDEPFLVSINGGKSLYGLKPGDTVTVPNVTPFRIEDVKKHEMFKSDDALSARSVIVDTREKWAAIWEGEKIVAAFPITPGKEKFIHRGMWEIKSMVTTPEFRWDKQMLEQGKRGEEAFQLPPGPNSPVGIFWAGTSKSGIGLHGTNSPHTIGRSQSAGCIRLANWDAVRLSALIRPGAKVEIR